MILHGLFVRLQKYKKTKELLGELKIKYNIASQLSKHNKKRMEI